MTHVNDIMHAITECDIDKMIQIWQAHKLNVYEEDNIIEFTIHGAFIPALEWMQSARVLTRGGYFSSVDIFNLIETYNILVLRWAHMVGLVSTFTVYHIYKAFKLGYLQISDWIIETIHIDDIGRYLGIAYNIDHKLYTYIQSKIGG